MKFLPQNAPETVWQPGSAGELTMLPHALSNRI